MLPVNRKLELNLKPEAYFLGLTQREISNQIRQGFFGGQAQRLQDGKDELRVWVRYPKEDRINVGKLESMKIKTPRGIIPLTQLVDYQLDRGPVSIQRFNGSKEVRIESDLYDPYASVPPILAKINEDVISEMKSQYPGVEVLYQGQARSSDESVAQIQAMFSLAFAIIIIYTFNSF